MQHSMCNTGGAGFKHIAAEQSIRSCSATWVEMLQGFAQRFNVKAAAY
jgi:hypothetical protein